MMRWIILLLALVGTLSACEEGGSRGSGVSTAVEGNIVSVNAAGSDDSGGVVAGITVAIDGDRARDQTDAGGQFVLHGTFDGPVRLIFQRAADALLARITVTVPAGGTLTLHNVHIEARQEIATAETQEVECRGIIREVRCSEALLTMVSAWDRADDPGVYTVRLETSLLRDARGNPLTCEDLRSGDRALVQALVQADGSFGDGLIQVDD